MNSGKVCNLRSKLTAAQLFRLSILCADHDAEMSRRVKVTDKNVDEMVRREVAVQSPIARLLYDAGVTCDDFGAWGYDNYHSAYMLAAVAGSPDSFPPGSGGHHILIAAGIRSNDPATWPAVSDDE